MNIIQKILFYLNKSIFKGINWKKTNLSAYVIHNIAYNESGELTGETYNYYLYIHPSGQKIIMRENSTETEYRYTSGYDWGNRQILNYTHYNLL